MSESQHVAAEVISASLAGIFSASTLYPLEVLKTKMQASSTTIENRREMEDARDLEKDSSEDGDEKEGKETSPKNAPTSTVELAKKMYEEEGIEAFYNGVGTSAFQSATEKALYFFAYTTFKNMYTSVVSTKEIGPVANLSE